ncbi:MAG: glycine--tRNA ligase subunit beta [Proteobacteria bacterium]|nr:glycine--tRNA ligase subunit beta [Pseudomonadota bacterium]
MSVMQPLLIELGTEELPVKALPGLAQAFFDGVLAGLVKRGIAVEHANVRPLYTPRRLAVLLPGVAAEQPEQRSEVLGPYLNIGLDANGQPTPALRGFAQKNGVDPAQLVRVADAKGERFAARRVQPGAATAALLPEIVREALAGMPIPKPMRWADHDYGFARPAHWLVLLHGKQVVEADVFGVRADRMSRGHRFHHPGPVWIGEPGDYVEALRGAFVLVDAHERRERVRSEVEAAAAQSDGHASIPDDLLEEVNGLVEWPRAIACGFEPDFLRVPHEALVSTMQANQKFFPVLDAENRLTARFIGVANLDSADPAQIRKGYERVIRPRFADAQFFFDEDVKQGLDAMRVGLAAVTYQQKLGSYADKSARVAALAEAIAAQLGLDPAQARRAAELSKADLLSRMVGEFPELQGIAGRYYAAAAGEPGAVADAIDHAYMPRFSGDAIAPSKLGQVLAIAEKLDTLAGGFAAGLKPTGNKDPFALRRHALGLARTLIEGGIEIELAPLLVASFDHNDVAIAASEAERKLLAMKQAVDAGVAVKQAHVNVSSEYSQDDVFRLYDFILDRLRGYYAEQGFTGAQFDAVATVRPSSLLDFDRRLRAIGEFAALPEAPALAAANKRIGNILKKSTDAIPATADPALFETDAERALHAAVEDAASDTAPLLERRDYVGVLRRLASLRSPVDAFFDGVLVNAQDARVRGNRLALLKQIADRFGEVADIAMLASG